MRMKWEERRWTKRREEDKVINWFLCNQINKQAQKNIVWKGWKGSVRKWKGGRGSGREGEEVEGRERRGKGEE
jgi:hypothetical protein